MKTKDKTRFLEAVCGGSGVVVKNMIKNGANPNQKYRGRSMLHWAAQEGRYGVLKILIAAGAKINSVDPEGETPIFAAVSHSKIVTALIRSGAKINISRMAYPCTPLHLACSFGYLSTVKSLLKNGANSFAKDSSKRTPLYYASAGKYYDIIYQIKKSRNAK